MLAIRGDTLLAVRPLFWATMVGVIAGGCANGRSILDAQPPDAQIPDAQPAESGLPGASLDGSVDSAVDAAGPQTPTSEFDRCPGASTIETTVEVDGAVHRLSGPCERIGTPYPIVADTGFAGGGDWIGSARVAIACDPSGRVLALGVETAGDLARTGPASVLYIDSDGRRHATRNSGVLAASEGPPEIGLMQREPFEDVIYAAPYSATFDDGTEIRGTLRACWVTFHDRRAFYAAVTDAFGPGNGLTLFE